MRHQLLTRSIALAATFAVSLAAAAAELHPFVVGSMAQIRAANAGRPHIIALWSLTCPPCHDELALLGAFRRDHPDMRLVLISTDSPADAPALEATLQRHGLGQLDSWVFADDYLERLRHEIDPAWRGELPRTYLYRRTGEAQVHTGTLTREMLTRWLAR